MPEENLGNGLKPSGRSSLRGPAGLWWLALAFVVAGCEYPCTGVVIGKTYRPPFRYSTVAMVGKVPVTTWHTRPECWQLAIRDGDSFNSGCVPKKYYDALNLGDTAWVTWN